MCISAPAALTFSTYSRFSLRMSRKNQKLLLSLLIEYRGIPVASAVTKLACDYRRVGGEALIHEVKSKSYVALLSLLVSFAACLP